MAAKYRFACLVVLLLPLRRVQLRTHGCLLQPSDLGPDWYKVPQPVPAGFENKPDYEPHYIHMPCAIATVFDEEICGCTNLEAYLFRGVQKLSASGAEQELDPHDMVKQRDPDDFQPPQKEKSGSILLNTRTGEVTHCPFRASSRGSMWYLIREPTDVWRPMKCAPGTVFNKKSCTCIHLSFASREPSKPEDQDIVVLEDVYDNDPRDNTISSTLQIKASDIDFSSKPSPDSWLHTSFKDKKEQNRGNRKHAPIVVQFPDENGYTEKHKISAGSERLPKVDQLKIDIRKASPLFLDTIQNRNAMKDNDLFFNDQRDDTSHRSLIFRPFESNRSSKNGTGQLKYNDNGNDIDVIVVKKTVKEAAPKRPNRNETTDERHDLQGFEFIGKPDKKIKTENLDQSLPQQKCAKRSIPELGPEYFSLYLWGVGWIPYACHGDRIYSDLLCACVPFPG